MRQRNSHPGVAVFRLPRGFTSPCIHFCKLVPSFGVQKWTERPETPWFPGEMHLSVHLCTQSQGWSLQTRTQQQAAPQVTPYSLPYTEPADSENPRWGVRIPIALL